MRLFAALREAAGTTQIEVDPAPLSQIVRDLQVRFGEPFATRVKVASGLVDGRRVHLDDDVRVESGSELALLPPFSGGSAVATTRERRVHRLLLAGSLLVPALLIVGLYSARWAFGVVVVVLAVGSLIDLHSTLAVTGVRTVLPAALLMGAGPAALLLLAPAPATSWVAGWLAVGVMLTFLLAFASSRRVDTASIVGSTLLAALLVAIGTATLIVLRDVEGAARLTGVLALIALTDMAVAVAGRPLAQARTRHRLIAAVTAALPTAVVIYAAGERAAGILLVAGFAVTAVIAALGSARLREVLRQPGGEAAAEPTPALLIGTTDAVLLGAPLAAFWVQLVLR